MKSLILPILIASSLYAQSGSEIAKMVHQRKLPKDMTADLSMVLTNKKGETRTSRFHSVSVDGGEKQIIWFLAPADNEGMAFLKIEHDDKDDEMRMWLPAFNKIRRISTKKKGASFMGSDISYEDMTRREFDDYTYEILGEEEINGLLCWKLKSIPKKGITKRYTHHVTWFDKIDMVPLKEESFDKKNTLIKRKTFKYIKIADYITPMEIFVENVQKEHSTKLTFENLNLDSGIPDALFQEKNMKRIPKS